MLVGPDDLLAIAEAVIRLQRDHGDRGDRRRARLKYLVDDRGLPWVHGTLASYFGRPIAPPRPMPAFVVPDLLGWHAQGDGRDWLGVPVPSGRIADTTRVGLRTALREIVAEFGANPVVTPQQDILLADLDPAGRDAVEAVLRRHNVTLAGDLTPMARWALACPALPTCGLALTEAERVREPIVAQFEAALRVHGLESERISLRITGCPNGCARTYTGDIGLVGRVPGAYAIYVGGDFEGTRLSFRLLDRVPEATLASVFGTLVAEFAARREIGESFGDFCNRLGKDALLALVSEARSAA